MLNPPQVLVVGGGVAVGHKVRQTVLQAQQEQKALTAELMVGRVGAQRKPPKVAVNKLFLRRLLTILSMCALLRDCDTRNARGLLSSASASQ